MSLSENIKRAIGAVIFIVLAAGYYWWEHRPEPEEKETQGKPEVVVANVDLLGWQRAGAVTVRMPALTVGGPAAILDGDARTVALTAQVSADFALEFHPPHEATSKGRRSRSLESEGALPETRLAGRPAWSRGRHPRP